MKTDFEARPIFPHDDVRIKAHFLICFLALVIYCYLEKALEYSFTCETILDKLRSMNFADIQERGFIPLYTRDKLTDALHEICGFDTDFKFINKSQMKTIQKKVREENKILWFKTMLKIATAPVFSSNVAILFLFNCQKQDYKRKNYYFKYIYLFLHRVEYQGSV